MDSTITSPSANQWLQYDGTKWVNATVSNSTALSSLTDCTVTTPSDNQLLQYNTWHTCNIINGNEKTLMGMVDWKTSPTTVIKHADELIGNGLGQCVPADFSQMPTTSIILKSLVDTRCV